MQHNFRFRKSVATTLTALVAKTGKNKTRLLEEAIMMHAKEL